MKLKAKIKHAYQLVKGEIQLLWLWVKNFCFVFLTTKSQFRIFEGYAHYWFAQRYADRRTKISKINEYCGGKRHYVIPVGDYTLAVINSLELKNLKAKNIIKKNFNIMKVLENAYYVSK